MKKEDITPPELENVDTSAHKLPKAIRDIIAKQGEESFLQMIGGLIKKHVKLHVDLTSGQIRLSIAGAIVFNENFKKPKK